MAKRKLSEFEIRRAALYGKRWAADMARLPPDVQRTLMLVVDACLVANPSENKRLLAAMAACTAWANDAEIEAGVLDDEIEAGVLDAGLETLEALAQEVLARHPLKLEAIRKEWSDIF